MASDTECADGFPYCFLFGCHNRPLGHGTASERQGFVC
jgi:hypothetical protein